MMEESEPIQSKTEKKKSKQIAQESKVSGQNPNQKLRKHLSPVRNNFVKSLVKNTASINSNVGSSANASIKKNL